MQTSLFTQKNLRASVPLKRLLHLDYKSLLVCPTKSEFTGTAPSIYFTLNKLPRLFLFHSFACVPFVLLVPSSCLVKKKGSSLTVHLCGTDSELRMNWTPFTFLGVTQVWTTFSLIGIGLGNRGSKHQGC